MKLKMSQILEEADPNLQITGSYLTMWDKHTQKAEGYCAMGLLACRSNSVRFDGLVTSQDDFLFGKYGLTEIQVDEIITCPSCLNGDGCAGYSSSEPKNDTISRLIIHMNDEHKLTYKEIAKYLRPLKF